MYIFLLFLVEELYCKLNYHDQKIQQTLARDILDSCFDVIRTHQQYITWSPPPLEIKPVTTECKAETLPQPPILSCPVVPYVTHKCLLDFLIIVIQFIIQIILKQIYLTHLYYYHQILTIRLFVFDRTVWSRLLQKKKKKENTKKSTKICKYEQAMNMIHKPRGRK